MFLAKIKDSFMFGGSPNKSHWYLVYTRKNKVLYLKETTHLYLPDSKRMNQVKNGYLRKAYITSFDTPTVVYKKKINKSFSKETLTISNVKNNSTDIRSNIKCRYSKIKKG